MSDHAHERDSFGEIDLGDGFFLRWLESGNAIWKHPACRPWAHIDLTTGKHHGIVSRSPVTLTPSLLCPFNCGTHGYIRDGKWVPA